MTQGNLISVIIPVYNTEKYLHKCIDSVLSQTYKSIEIILVDDGSTDSSLSICMAYAEKDNRIIVLSKENGGQATARNLGLEYAKGDFIGFVDSDDWISSNMYEVMLIAMIQNDADITVCGRENVGIDGEVLNSFFTYENGFEMDKVESIRRFLTYDGIDGSSCDKLFRSKVVKKLKYETGLICEDLPFIYRALKRANKIYHTGLPLYHYFQRQNSTSRSVYNKKSYGMVKYPADIRKDIYQSFPQLKSEADFYYWFGLINYMKMIEDSCVRNDTHLEELSIPSMLELLRCRYLSKHLKIVFATIKLRIYRLIKSIRGCVHD